MKHSKRQRKLLKKRYSWLVSTTAVTLLVAGCTSPMERDIQAKLREQMEATQRQYMNAAGPAQNVKVSRTPSDVEAELSDERRAELDEISGPTAYKNARLDLGSSLTGQTEEQTPTVAMTLQQAIQMAVKNNLSVQVSRLNPAISQTQVIQAKAAFDATFFINYDFQKLDTPTPLRNVIPVTGDFIQSTNHTITTGIRKRTATGATATIQTQTGYIDQTPTSFVVNSYYTANVMASVTQPLLRNFGPEVNLAEIELAASARDQSNQELRTVLLDTALGAERAYWNLVLARQQLLIQLRLLERTIEDRDVIKKREPYDASPVRVTEANSFVELRRADVIRARQTVRLASDALKQFINDPELSVAGETLILPADAPIEEPVEFNLTDAIRTSLQKRPEIKQSLLLIKDTEIRQRVASNLRLPKLDLSAGVRVNGMSENALGRAYENIGDGDFIDYLFGIQFEQPIGNRLADAFYHQRKLERSASVLAYRRQAQNIVVEIKNALRQIESTYEIIGAARAARRAASDNLRALERQEKAGINLTPEFLLDLKLSTQQRLADAEIQEMQALTDYNTAIASYYRTTGTLLERNQIDFKEDVSGEIIDRN